MLCVSALNYFFIPPRYTFEVERAEYWWMLAVLLALSLALNVLVANLRQRQARAESGKARAAQGGVAGRGNVRFVEGRVETLGERGFDCVAVLDVLYLVPRAEWAAFQHDGILGAQGGVGPQ